MGPIGSCSQWRRALVSTAVVTLVQVLKLLGDNTTDTVDMQYFEALHLATKHSAYGLHGEVIVLVSALRNLPLIYRFVEALQLHDRFMQFDKDGDNELTLEEVEIKAEDADKQWVGYCSARGDPGGLLAFSSLGFWTPTGLGNCHEQSGKGLLVAANMLPLLSCSG